MDFSNIFSMIFANKNNNFNNNIKQNNKQESTQNIYPNCTFPEQKQNSENNKNNIFSSNNSENNILASLLPLLMSGQSISMQEILKNMGTNNPLISSILTSFENKQTPKKETSKIDVSDLIKVE